MTIKTKKVKEIIDGIEQEQQEDKLNFEQKVDDWRERHILQSEELHQVEKDLESKTKEAERNERAFKLYIENTLKKEKTLEQRIKALEEKNESEEIALLKETHQREIRKVREEVEYNDFLYSSAIEGIVKRNDEVKELKKELEEKELLVEELRQENKVLERGREANLDAIGVGIKFEVEKISGEIESLKTKLNDKSEILLDFIDALAKEKVQNEKLLGTIQKDQEVLKENSEELAKLRQKLYFATKPLPSLPKKQNKFQKLRTKIKTKLQQSIKKEKYQKQELVAKVEVLVKK